MVLRILVLVGFLVIPPSLYSLYNNVSLSWFFLNISAWTVFWAAVGQLSGYNFRDFIKNKGKWNVSHAADTWITGGIKMDSKPKNEDDLKQLKERLARKRELLDATENRLHELRVKRQKLGLAMPPGEIVELKEAEKEAQQLREEIIHLKTQIQNN